MIQWKNRMLCEYCLEECEAEQCVHCGNNSTIEHTPTGCLPPKTILKERYIIGKVLGRGGFGITYLAFDMLEDCRVAIKEYFPDNLVFRQPGDIQVHSYTNAEQADSFRSGSEKFYTEAQTMARFNGHPNIVNVQRFFYENQTAYYVMEYLDGIDLKKYLDIHGKRLSFEDTMKLLLPVMDAMTLVHSTNILHRDISPDNIFILKDGTVKLLDFGSARQVLAEQSKSLSVILKVGFAPVEQYQSHGKQGPWTDIYALAATMYYCLTGEIPVAAMDRVEEDHLKKISELCPEIGKKADKIFAKALAVRAVNRYQSMAEFRDDLMTLIVSKTALPTMPKTTSVTQMTKKFVWTKKRIIAVIAAAAVLICSSGIAYAAVKINEKKEVNREQSLNSEGLENVTDMPTPEPTATNTPVPTPSPEPTATSTPVPTPSPKPTATPSSSPYTFKKLQKTMYAKADTAVRNLPILDSTRVGSLSEGDAVEVTGQCNETNWYRIIYKDTVAYVNGICLRDNPPTPIPTPRPTATPTPKPTATPKPTTTPKPTATPTPTSKSAESLLPTNGSQQFFYKSVAADTAVFLGVYSDATSWHGELYRYDTGMVYEIPQEMIEVGTKYTKIDNSVLLGQPEGKYHFTLYWTIESFGTVVYSSSKAWTIYIYDESTEVPKSVAPIYTNDEEFAYEKPWDLKKMIDSTSTKRFSYVTAKIQKNNMEAEDIPAEVIPAKYCEILCDGKVAFISREYFLQKFKKNVTISIKYYFDDGSTQKENITFVGGTVTPTPTPKPTNTPTPTPTIEVRYHFYKNLSEEMPVIYYTGRNSEAASVEVSYREYGTEKWNDIYGVYIQFGERYVWVDSAAWKELKPTIYEIKIARKNENGDVVSSMKDVIQVHGKEDELTTQDFKFTFDAVPFSPEKPTNYTGVISNSISHIEQVKAEVEGYSEVIPNHYYELLYDGKVIVINKEYFLMRYQPGNQIRITFSFDNGRNQTRTVEFSESTMLTTPTPKPTVTPTPTMAVTPTIIPENDLVPANFVEYKFYKSVAKDTELIFITGNMVSWEGELYDYNTGMVYKIPQEMFEAYGKYCKLDNSVFINKPASKYHLTVTFKKTVTSEPERIAWIVEVYDNANIPPIIDNSLMYLGNYSNYEFAMQRNIEAIVHGNCTERLVSVMAEMSNMKAETIPSEYCELLWGGKAVIVNSQYLLQHFQSGETMTLTFYFESGHQMKKRITFAGGTTSTLP